MVVKTDDGESKQEETRKNKGRSYTVNSGKHIQNEIVKSIYYLQDIIFEIKKIISMYLFKR